MSILSAAVPDSPTAAVPLLIILFFTALSFILAKRFGVFRRSDIVGPHRLPQQGAGVLLLVFFITICTWICVQSAYLGYRQSQWKQAGLKNIPANVESLLTTRDWAFLSTVPPTLGFLVMLAAGLFMQEGWLDRLGLSPRKFRPGLFSGIIGFLIAGPPVFWTLMFLNVFYQYLQFQHPAEHVLLKSLGQSQTRGAGILIAIGATLCAPLFEEFLFRGHLQTLFRQMLMRLMAKPIVNEIAEPPLPVLADLEIVPGNEGIAPVSPVMLPYQPIPLPARVLQAAPWHGWMAILLTSLIFASFHPLWMAPPIFVLSLGLGYVYERTGNLWATITIHFLFNSLETMQYMLLIRGH